MLSNRRAKDQEMAARMKIEKVVRTSANCPICHGHVALSRLYMHIASACGGSSREEYERMDPVR